MPDLFKNILRSEESIFLNPQLLDFDYQPKLILHRENQQQRIAQCIKPILQRRNGINLIITGMHGVGKTVCLKHVLSELKEEFPNDVHCVYINCWKKNTAYKIAIDVCHQINYKFTHNKSYDELIKEASELLNEKSTVVVLDEADKLENNNIIYTLLEDLFRKCLILITNEKEYLITLDARIRSRLTPETLEFDPYNQEQTREILKERLKYAFVQNTMDKEAFDKITEITYELGDIRSGLFLMKEAGEITEDRSQKRITLEFTNQAITKLQDFKTKKIDSFETPDKKFIELIKFHSGKSTKELFPIYEKETGKSFRTFQRKLNLLQKSGIILLKEVNKGFNDGRFVLVEYNVNKKLDEF